MAGTVSFKVYLTSDEQETQEVRRFGVDPDVVTNFLYLREKLQSIFANLRGRRFTISWKDEDNDEVVISSDEELQIYLNETSSASVRKLYVCLYGDYSKIPDFNASPKDGISGIFHAGIMCDGCDKQVQGFRYKCIQCADYDLCSSCEGRGLHSEHSMLRLSVPVQWKPHYGRRLAHHMNRFVRKAVNNNLNATCSEEPIKCPFKENKEEKKEEKKEPKCHGRRRRHCANEGPSWVDTFAGYLNDWANLPGECPMKQGNPNATEKEDENAAKGAELLKLIGENLSQFLDPLGIDVNFQVKTDDLDEAAGTSEGAAKKDDKEENGKEEEKKEGNEEKKKEQTPEPKSSACDDEKNRNVEKEKSPSPAPSVSSEKSAGGADNEGWTIISQTEGKNNGAIPKLIPAAAAVGPSAPIPVAEEAKPAPPLYPQLPKPETKIYHPNPAIQKAVESMMQMGFSNEGNWLTNLLVSMNGDISRALDALQPVQRN